jgi:hypothetical protein
LKEIEMRTYLTAPSTYYISADGSDATGDGSSDNPWVTPAHAYAWCRDNLDLGGQKVTIQLLTGIVGSSTLVGPLTGQVRADDFQFLGNSAAPHCVTVVDPAPGATLFLAQEGARFGVCGMLLGAPGVGGFGLIVSEGVIAAHNLWFNTMGASSLDAAGPRSMIVGSGTLIWMHAQTFQCGAVAEDNAMIALCCNLTISGVPTFTGAFVQGDLGGMIDATGAIVHPGSAQGRRYLAAGGGKVFTGGTGNPNFFPGSIAGVIDSTSIHN